MLLKKSLLFDCSDDRLLTESNLERICATLGVEVGKLKRIRLLGASEPIARRLREGGDLSIFEEQFKEAAEIGINTISFGHHGDCQWYKRILTKRMANIGLSLQEVGSYYGQIETVVQFADMLESYNWVKSNGWFEECVLTFGHNTDQEGGFDFAALSPIEITQEIASLRKELEAGLTPEQLKCLEII